MRTRRTLRPGQPGTKRFVRRFGARLVCVRYRYSVAARCRVTTVEVVVASAPWSPPSDAVVGVRVRVDEVEVRRRVKAAGGRWDAGARVWRLAFGAVEGLGLVERVVEADV